MSRRPATILQADVAQDIREARERGRDSVSIPLPNGCSVVIRGLFNPPKSRNAAWAAQFCGCTPEQFKIFISAQILPSADKQTRQWDEKLLEVAKATLDVRPDTFTYSEVYFVEMGDFIKIGFSGSAHIRIRDLQTATPYDLKLLLTIPGTDYEEGRIHSLFSDIRHRGEWFHKTKALMAYIDWLKARPA